jgi:hypothetical protein
MMVISCGLNALYGLIALVNDEWVMWTNRGSLYLDISEWGWIHLIVGLALCSSRPGHALMAQSRARSRSWTPISLNRLRR